MVFYVHKTLLCIHIHVTGRNLWNFLLWSYEVGAIAATILHSGVSYYLTFLLSQNQCGTKLGVIHHQS